MARKIRDGPVTSGGGGMLALFHYQGASRTAMIVEQCHKKNYSRKISTNMHRRSSNGDRMVQFIMETYLQSIPKIHK